VIGYLWLAFVRAAATPVTDAGIEFFESKIRPLLTEECYRCHSRGAEKIRGGLLLDTQEGMLKGGDSGPAIVPGNPGKSLLIKAVRYTDDALQMPPKNRKLSAVQIAALEEWVRMGAPDPRRRSLSVSHEAAAAMSGESVSKTQHWAFRPVHMPELPTVRNEAWVQSPLDRFILARQEAVGLEPSPPADKRTLVRRVTYDLTGLPPTIEEVDAFLADSSPNAFEAVVERLLASPRYGERWARHWLDVARYADTKGYVFEEERRYSYAYTYRDYVIRAFNEDLPYDRFIVEQLAADQLPLCEDKRPLAALGFLTLGRRFLNNPHDIIDDRIDVVTRGMMALTVTCARCHDHKFDPISTRDYYALYGVFASCSEPEEKPLLGTAVSPRLEREYLGEHAKRQDELTRFRKTKEAEIRSQVRQSAGEYMLAARDVERLPDPSKAEALARGRKLDPPTVQRWVAKLEQWRKQPDDHVFGPWFDWSGCTDDELSHTSAPEFAASLEKHAGLNRVVAHFLSGSAPLSLRELADRYGALFAEVDRVCSAGQGADAGLDVQLQELQHVLFGEDSPTHIPDTEITRLFDVPSIQKLRALKRKVEELDATHPGAPARAMVLQDNPEPQTPHVFVRGNPSNPGPEVPRQFLAVLAGENRQPFRKGSGRLELAEAIASPRNPLTARVIVNRVWMQYFGSGLVRTASDFGLRSDPPTDPELLDYLAARFMAEGWSLKNLHRSITLSSTYQQASDDNSAGLGVDPGNQLLWKMNRRRLDFEAVRDSLLAAAARLDETAGGQSVDIVSEPWTTRRTVYGFVERQNLPNLFRTFDFAGPDTTSPGRFMTTIPQQALFMLNSGFVVQQAEWLTRLAVLPITGDVEKIRSLYKRLYQREPSPNELSLGLKFVEAKAAAASGQQPMSSQESHAPSLHPLSNWERYAQVLLMSNEFVFVD
jgi:hypothetical protein